MEAIRVNPDEFKLENFINYYNDNVEELLSEYPNYVSRICLIDRDYMDVVVFDSNDSDYIYALNKDKEIYELKNLIGFINVDEDVYVVIIKKNNITKPSAIETSLAVCKKVCITYVKISLDIK